ISEGEEALQRILIRAREPGGTINVFQQTENLTEIIEKPAVENVDVKILNADIKVEEIQPIPKPSIPNLEIKQFAQAKPVLPEKPIKTNGDNLPPEKNPTTANQNVSLSDFPFRLSNKVEELARKNQEISDKDWQTLLNLTVELLTTIDKTLAQAKLDFTSAFRMVCAEISDDYPFLNPADGTFAYSKGKVKMTEQVNSKIFVTSLIEAIRRILNKLESNPKFSRIHRAAVQSILAVMHKRENLYEKFDMTSQLKRILGV
ncbi:MAG: hypothetical protein ACR2J3_04670, partial [Aridibacter sp.]